MPDVLVLVGESAGGIVDGDAVDEDAGYGGGRGGWGCGGATGDAEFEAADAGVLIQRGGLQGSEGLEGKAGGTDVDESVRDADVLHVGGDGLDVGGDVGRAETAADPDALDGSGLGDEK